MRKNNKNVGEGSNQLPKDFISSLIKQNKSKMSKAPASSSTCHSGSNKAGKFIVTPKGILHKTLCDALGKDISINQLDKFISSLLSELSLLSSGGGDKDLFSTDFDCFFTMVVQMLNLCGTLKDILDQNGIEVDIKALLENGQDGNKDDET